MMKKSCFFSPLNSSKTHISLSLSLSCVCVLFFFSIRFIKRELEEEGVKLFFSRFYNGIKRLSLFFSERRERQSATKRGGLFCF